MMLHMPSAGRCSDPRWAPAGAGVTAVYLAKAKRVLMPVLMALAGAAAVAAIMALKIAIYLPRFIHR